MEKGYFKIDGKITYSYEYLKSETRTDYLQWIVDSKGLHFGKIALLDRSIAGVLLCYTQPKNHKAFLSNIAVVRQHRRKGVGSTLMQELMKFYRNRSNIEVIELNVGFTNGIATKFHLDHNFKIVKIRDTGYTAIFSKECPRCQRPRGTKLNHPCVYMIEGWHLRLFRLQFTRISSGSTLIDVHSTVYCHSVCLGYARMFLLWPALASPEFPPRILTERPMPTFQTSIARFFTISS